MKPIEEFSVSMYALNNSTKNVAVPLINVLRGIITGELKEKINTIRFYMLEGDTKSANMLKAELPCFTVSGVFNGSHAARNLVAATGLVVLDFDDVKDLELLRAVCNADTHTVGSFRSPKDGFKVIVHVENAAGRHKEAYVLARAHYEEITGLELDGSGSDLSRTCLMSYDPDGYIATLYDSFVLPEKLPEAEQPEQAASEVEESAAASQDNAPAPTLRGESFAGREKAFIDANLFLSPLHVGNRNSGSFALGCRAAQAGCDFETVFIDLAERICDGDFKKSDLKRNLTVAYQRVRSTPASARVSSPDGGVTDKATNRHYIYATTPEGEEDVYRAGEELRNNTPCFPDELYENIPSMLRECLESGMGRRRRDVRLLSCLVAYSALVVNTSGQYGHKCYSPHLYAWIIAPPAGGKGAAGAAASLLDVTNAVIEKESDAALERYEEELEDYKDCRLHNRRSKEKVPVPDKPVRPPYRSLMIPANTSNSRVIMQLRDNAELGGLLFDTEADTLTANNKQDYGHLDAILCKAAEHEPVASSFFTHGLKPVSCRHPYMAMLLTSTTTQVCDLLGCVDKGLGSRTLIHTFGYDEGFRPVEGEGESTDDVFERLSEKAFSLFRFCRANPLVFRFTHTQWGILNDTFNSLSRHAFLEERDDLQATVRRYAVCVMRVAMVLSRLHQFEGQATAPRMECTDAVFCDALSLVLCCYEHCRLLFTSFGRTHMAPLKNPDDNVFPLDELPQRFTHAEAVKVGVSHHFTERSVERVLKKLMGVEINRISRGCYEKSVV